MKPSRTRADNNPVLAMMHFPNGWWREVLATTALEGLFVREESARVPEILAQPTCPYADAMIAPPARPTPRE